MGLRRIMTRPTPAPSCLRPGIDGDRLINHFIAHMLFTAPKRDIIEQNAHMSQPCRS